VALKFFLDSEVSFRIFGFVWFCEFSWMVFVIVCCDMLSVF